MGCKTEKSLTTAINGVISTGWVGKAKNTFVLYIKLCKLETFTKLKSIS